jgi:hypothetical protein
MAAVANELIVAVCATIIHPGFRVVTVHLVSLHEAHQQVVVLQSGHLVPIVGADELVWLVGALADNSYRQSTVAAQATPAARTSTAPISAKATMILFIAQRPFFGTPHWSTFDTIISKPEVWCIPQMSYFSTDPAQLVVPHSSVESSQAA